MKRAFLSVVAALLAGGVARADANTMSRIVFHQAGPDIDPASFAARPKTIYQWGAEKGRVEEATDPEHQLTGLLIVDGADAWMLNLYAQTGNHVIDPGPTHNFYVPIVPPTGAHAKPPVSDFLIGHELEFMQHHQAQPVATQRDDKAAQFYQCEAEGYTLQLYVDATTRLPVESDVLKDGKVITRLIYDDYEPALPADPSLFRPPAGLLISDGPP